VLAHCWVNTPHIHTSEWDSLFFQGCLLPTVAFTPSDSDYVKRSASIQRFRLFTRLQPTITGTILRIRATGCMRTRQSSYKIVGNCSDKGGHRYQPLLLFLLREVLARRLAMFMLCVMTYVVSYKLFWDWVGFVCKFKLYLTRFVLTKGLFFDTFFIRNFYR